MEWDDEIVKFINNDLHHEVAYDGREWTSHESAFNDVKLILEGTEISAFFVHIGTRKIIVLIQVLQMKQIKGALKEN